MDLIISQEIGIMSADKVRDMFGKRLEVIIRIGKLSFLNVNAVIFYVDLTNEG